MRSTIKLVTLFVSVGLLSGCPKKGCEYPQRAEGESIIYIGEGSSTSDVSGSVDVIPGARIAASGRAAGSDAHKCFFLICPKGTTASKNGEVFTCVGGGGGGGYPAPTATATPTPTGTPTPTATASPTATPTPPSPANKCAAHSICTCAAHDACEKSCNTNGCRDSCHGQVHECAKAGCFSGPDKCL